MVEWRVELWDGHKNVTIQNLDKECHYTSVQIQCHAFWDVKA